MIDIGKLILVDFLGRLKLIYNNSCMILSFILRIFLKFKSAAVFMKLYHLLNKIKKKQSEILLEVKVNFLLSDVLLLFSVKPVLMMLHLCTLK